MGALLREWLIRLGLNLIGLWIFLGVLFNWSPAWFDHPGNAVAWLLGYAGWLLVPAMAWVALNRRFGEIGALVVSSFWDADGWPVVTWREPRFDGRALVFKVSRVRARCYTREADGLRLFCYQVADVHDFREGSDCIAVPLAGISGFSVTTAAQIYRTPDPRGLSDGGHVVLRAELDPPLPGGQSFIPLTFTAAPQSEVEALHRMLSQVFAPGGLASRVAQQGVTSRGAASQTVLDEARVRPGDGSVPDAL